MFSRTLENGNSKNERKTEENSMQKKVKRERRTAGIKKNVLTTNCSPGASVHNEHVLAALTKLIDRKAMLPSVTEVRVAKSPLR